jgi:hypothetical protein
MKLYAGIDLHPNNRMVVIVEQALQPMPTLSA